MASIQKFKAERYCGSKYGEFVTFKYRGYLYDVNYNIFTCSTPAYIQHRQNQETIDKFIEQKSKADKLYAEMHTNDVEEALKEFWDFVDG